MSEPKRQNKSRKSEPYTDELAAPFALETIASKMSHNDATMKRMDARWLEVFAAATGDTPEARRANVDHCLRSMVKRWPEKAEAIRKALDNALPATVPFSPDPQGPPPIDLGIIGTADFASRSFIRKFFIQRVLVAGKPAIMAGPKKALKTTLMVEMLVSLASGTPFLGEFLIPSPVKTLLISGESGEATIQETMRRICAAKGTSPEEIEGMAFWGFRLPNIGIAAELEALALTIREHEIKVVLIDPVYLCLIGSKVDPANLFDVGPLLKRFSDACLEAGATPILAHHFRKNRESPYDPPELEDIAFAGFQEFARQWLLIGRREKCVPGTGKHDLWLSVGGSDGHSGEWAVNINEGVTDEDFHDREWNVEIVSGTAARDQAKAQVAAAKLQAAEDKAKIAAERKAKQERADLDELIAALSAAPGHMATVATIRKKTGWRSDKAEFLLSRLCDAGVAAPEPNVPTMIGSVTKHYPGYRLTGEIVG